MERSNLEILLLVEDEPDHAQLIMESLVGNGSLVNEIVWVENGRRALDYIFREGEFASRDNKLGMVLLDLKLPELDGFEVLEKIKTDSKYKDLPVVVLSTSDMSQDIKRALQLGANDYITKPVRWEDFVGKVKGLGKYWAFISEAVK